MIIFLAVIFLFHTSLAQAVSQPTDWLWAWDRTEDLRWIPENTGVAYFAVQFDARDAAFVPTWRRAPLHVRPETQLIPVLHIEAFYILYPAVLDDEAVILWSDKLAKAIKRLAAPEVQIDFEARAHQHDFYRKVLLALRTKVPATTRISITALASWCGDAIWLSSLPVDEVVPMYFRMGPSERTLWRRRMVQPVNLPPVCRNAAGVSTDEWQAFLTDVDDMAATSIHVSDARRFYIFSPRAWRITTADDIAHWRSITTGDHN